jgi:hypothetical protein
VQIADLFNVVHGCIGTVVQPLLWGTKRHSQDNRLEPNKVAHVAVHGVCRA